MEPNGESLTDLQRFSTEEGAVYYSAEDLELLTPFCPDLDNLSIDLGDLSPIINNLGVHEPFRLAGLDEYTQKLVSIIQSTFGEIVHTGVS